MQFTLLSGDNREKEETLCMFLVEGKQFSCLFQQQILTENQPVHTYTDIKMFYFQDTSFSKSVVKLS